MTTDPNWRDVERLEERKSAIFGVSFSVIPTVAVIALLAGSLYGCPKYNTWKKEQTGRAAYAEAEQNRRIVILEAQAKKESATQLGEADVIRARQWAEAEVIRAEGTAKANAIVADGLGGPEGYLRYLYIDKLAAGNGQSIIYVPTEAGLPILEAGRRKQ